MGFFVDMLLTALVFGVLYLIIHMLLRCIFRPIPKREFPPLKAIDPSLYRSLMKEPKYKKLDAVFYATESGYHVGIIEEVIPSFRSVFYAIEEDKEKVYRQDVLYPSLTALKAAFDERFDQEHPDYAPREIEINRSAETGRFVSDEEVKANPAGTVTEIIEREY